MYVEACRMQQIDSLWQFYRDFISDLMHHVEFCHFTLQLHVWLQLSDSWYMYAIQGNMCR